ncbi:MAG: PhzF family phenazine biosynthesis protein, partial [Candidatus Hodarchaeota archaeon]
VGVLEDPATGSAAGPLGAYLEIHNCIAKKAKGSETVLEQGYEMYRPSKLLVQCHYDKEELSEVLVSGKVRFVAEGKFFL